MTSLLSVGHRALWSGLSLCVLLLSAEASAQPAGPQSQLGLGDAFSADPSTGALSFSVPIDVPPGFLKPELSLSYTAGAGKGVMGLSFDLPLTCIYRTTNRGLPHFDEDDRFAITGQLSGELVRVAEGRYRLRHEGAHALFERGRDGDNWTIQLPDGRRMELGTSSDSRETAGRHTVRWCIERELDDYGHETRHLYFRDAGRLYWKEIRYQVHVQDQDSYLNRVVFYYESRPDQFSDYRYGDPIVTEQRLAKVTVHHGKRTLKTYTLGYAQDPLFSLLQTVDVTGEQGERLPTLRLSYYRAGGESGAFVRMQQAPPPEGLVNGLARLEDVDGDGLTDLLYGVGGQYSYYRNVDGARWEKQEKDLLRSPDRHLNDPSVALVDVDGDGFDDIVHEQASGFRYYSMRRDKNGQVGFDAPLDIVSAEGVSFASSAVRVCDLNGDGRADALYQKPGEEVALMNREVPGGARRLESEPLEEELPLDANFHDPRFALMDFNGDSVVDLVFKNIQWNASEIRVWFGRGFGKFAPAESMIGVPNGAADEFSLLDVNRDGQTDLVQVSGSWVSYYVNDGDLHYASRVGPFKGMPDASETVVKQFADMNGNGTTDVVWVTRDDEILYLDLLSQPFFGLLSKIDNGMGGITEIRYDTSTAQAIAAERRNAPWRVLLRVPMPVVRELVTRDSMTLVGAAEQVTRVRYTYADGYYHFRDQAFRGFGRVVTEQIGDAQQPTSVSEQYFHLGFDFASGKDYEALTGKPYLELTKTADGRKLTSVETLWEQRWLCQEALPAQSRVVLPSCSDVERLDSKYRRVAIALPMGSLVGSWEEPGVSSGRAPKPVQYSAVRTDYDAFGAPTSQYDFGRVKLPAGRVLGTPVNFSSFQSEIDGDEVRTETNYIYDLEHWRIGLVSATRRYDSGAKPLAEAHILYDGLPLGQVKLGKVSGLEAWLDTQERWITTAQFAYNRHGMLQASLSPEGECSETDYDAETGSFAVSSSQVVSSGMLDGAAIDAVNWRCSDRVREQRRLTTYTAYDRAFGAATAVTDENRQATHMQLDGLGRPVAVFTPLDVPDQPSERYQYQFGTALSPLSVTRRFQLTNRATGAYYEMRSFADGLGRARLTKVVAEAPHDFMAADFVEYGARGYPAKHYQSFASQSLAFEVPPQGSPAATIVYDAVGRVVESREPEELTVPAWRAGEPQRALTPQTVVKRTVYLPWETHIYDELAVAEPQRAKAQTVHYDAHGRVVDIEQEAELDRGPTTVRFGARYDALGRMIAFFDGAAPSKEALSSGGADVLAPCEEPGDGMGPNPQRSIPNVRRYCYDSLGRQVASWDPHLGGVIYRYDDAGHLREREDTLGQVESYGYDSLGRMVRRDLLGDARGKADEHYSYLYDVADPSGPFSDAQNLRGKLTRVSFPVGERHYDYDALGRVAREGRSLWDPTSSSFSAQVRDTHVRTIAYDVVGKPVRVQGPGALETTFSYNARQKPVEIRAGLNGALEIIAQDFTYSERGLLVRVRLGNGVHQCERHDTRGRRSATLLTRTAADCDALMRADEAQAGQRGFVNLRYQYTHDALIGRMVDLTAPEADVLPSSALFAYDRLRQLTAAQSELGLSEYAYDAQQRLVARSFQPAHPSQTRPEAVGHYQYSHAAPAQLTEQCSDASCETKIAAYAYDALGRLLSYRGHDLDYDVSGRLVLAQRPGEPALRYFYDDTGERVLTLKGDPEQAEPHVLRGFFADYEEREGDRIWRVAAGLSSVELREAEGVRIDAALLDELNAYVAGKRGAVKPLPDGYMDLNRDGVELDEADLALAVQAAWSGAKVGGKRVLHRYEHPDHLGSSSHVTDASGALVHLEQRHPYGQNGYSRGVRTAREFTGAPSELADDLGLIRMGARYYAPELGRWITPDRFIGEAPRSMLSRPLEANLYSYAGNNPVNFRDPTGQTNEPATKKTQTGIGAIHSMFKGAYELSTFKRKAFSVQDREDALTVQAHAEARHLGADVSAVTGAVENFVADNGAALKGIHLRHIIPYSDIAGVVYLATSDKTRRAMNPAFVDKVRQRVGELVDLIGDDQTKSDWASVCNETGLLTEATKRATVQGVYHALAHAQKNLFFGGGAANLVIGNRLDASQFAAGVHGPDHVRALYKWWTETMTELELEPRIRSVNLKVGRVQLLEHGLSRAPGSPYYSEDELPDATWLLEE